MSVVSHSLLPSKRRRTPPIVKIDSRTTLANMPTSLIAACFIFVPQSERPAYRRACQLFNRIAYRPETTIVTLAPAQYVRHKRVIIDQLSLRPPLHIVVSDCVVLGSLSSIMSTWPHDCTVDVNAPITGTLGELPLSVLPRISRCNIMCISPYTNLTTILTKEFVASHLSHLTLATTLTSANRLRQITIVCPHVHHLTLKYRDFRHLEALLPLAAQLETLCLTREDDDAPLAKVITLDSVQKLACALTRCTTLRLTMRARVAATFFVHAPAVRELHLETGFNLTRHILAFTATNKTVHIAPKLTTLVLQRMQLFMSSTEENLVDILARMCPTIRVLQLKQCEFHSFTDVQKDFIKFCSSLGQWHHLRTLELYEWNQYVTYGEATDEHLRKLLPKHIAIFIA